MKKKIRKEFTIKIKGHAEYYENLEEFSYSNVEDFDAFVKRQFKNYKDQLEELFNRNNANKTDTLEYLARKKGDKEYEDPYLHNFNFDGVDKDVDG
ncbi:MAG: hypothetical protein ABFS16_09985 [Bacteroidota bacterium]